MTCEVCKRFRCICRELAAVHRAGMMKAATICRDLGTPDGLFLSSEIRKAAEEAE